MRTAPRACIVVVAALILVVLPIRPAAADHVPPPGNPVAGSGTVEGTELLEEQEFVPGAMCLAATKHIFGWQGQGTYAGVTPGGQPVVYRAELAEGQALHDGPLEFTVETTQSFYHGPMGTHGSDSPCEAATAGSPVSAKFTVFAAGNVYKFDGSVQVPCTGVGSFVRLGPDWHGQWALDVDCIVVGNASGTPGTGVAKAQTVHTHEGAHDPCGGSCLDNFKLDYTEHPPVAGLAVNMAGPTTRAINRSTTLTAVVAYDGAPLSGASVAFSVAGPAATSPPGATVTTGASGQAAFTFTAAVEGDYVVTASATSSAYPGEERSTTRMVFFSGPRPVMTLDSMPRVQNGEPATVVALVVDESDPVANTNPKDPVAGVVVSFSVAPPAGGQATPGSGTFTTAGTGKAKLIFTANRAGAYTVTATASYAGVQMTTARIVHFDVKTMSVVGAIDLASNETSPSAAVMDPAGSFAYFATDSRIVKVNLTTFERVGSITANLGGFGGGGITAAAIDPAGSFAYFGSSGTYGGNPFGSVITPSRLVKVDLATFQQVGLITFNAGEQGLQTAVIDPAGDFAYVNVAGATGGLVKIDLNTFQRVATLTLSTGASDDAMIDSAGRYAYLTRSGRFPLSAQVTKVDLFTFQEVGSVTFADGEWNVYAAVIDPAGDYAYYGVEGEAIYGLVIKVDLRTMQRVGGIPLYGVGLATITDTVQTLAGAAMDPGGSFAYFGGQVSGAVVVKVDLQAFQVMHVIPMGGFNGTSGTLSPTVIDPDGEYAYFGKQSGSGPSVGHVVKLDLTRTPKPALVAGGESYATSYVTPLTVAAPGVLANDVDTEDADALTAGDASNPPGGSVSLNPDGSFTYTPDTGFSGTDSFTYQASDGIDLSAPATVSVTVGAPPAGVQSVVGGACGYYTNVSLFGGPQELKGCGQTESSTPSSAQVASRSASVSLAPTGSAGPLAATKPAGAIALYGPAALFSGIWPNDSAGPSPSGPQSATTEATTGPGGSATSSAHVVLHDTPLPVRCDGDPSGTTNCTAPGGIGPGPLIADEAHSTCTADESGLSGSAAFVNGVVETKYDADTQLPLEAEEIATNPAPNTMFIGTLDHVGDSFRVVLNEQILGPDSITVNAAHVYLLGPTAVGELIVGQSRCGVELAAPNAAPVTGDDAYTASSGQALTVPAAGLLANDTDTETHVLRVSPLPALAPPTSGGGVWSFPSDPDHGTLSLGADGSFVYTSDPGYTGPDSFTYQAQDSRGMSDTATVTLTVQPAPAAADDAYTTTEDAPLVVTAPGVVGNDTAPGGGPLSAIKVTDPAHGILAFAADGSFTYTPAANYFGPDSFAYQVNDGTADSNVAIVSLTVTSVNDAPVGNGDAYGTAYGTPLTVEAPGVVGNDTDVDGGTLTAGSASDPAGGTVVLNANGSFSYNPDSGFSGADTFTYTVSDGQGGSAGAMVTVTVAPSAGPTVLSVGDLWLPEGSAGSTATFTIVRNGTASGTSTVKYKTSGGTATAGTDYTAVPLTAVTFAPGETSKTVIVDLAGDTRPEKDETFNLVLSAPVGAALADASASATLVNDDGSSYLAVASVTVNEGSLAAFTVTRTGNIDGSSTAKYKTTAGSATAGTDYTTAALTDVSFGPGQASTTVTVPVAGDTTAENNETFNLVLSSPSVGTALSDASGAATIVDDEGPVTPGPATYLTVGDLMVAEGGPASFTITRTGVTGGSSTVRVRTSGGSAVAGSDYTAVALTTVTFGANETTRSVTVDITGDTAPEANETLNLVLSAPTGATIADASGTATVLNDDAPAYLTVGNVTVTEGDEGTTAATFTITRTGNTTAASTVKYKTSGGTATAGIDYAALALTEVSFAAGETTKAVTVGVAGDTTTEGNDTFNLVLSAPVGVTISDASGTATILNDD